MIKIIRALSAIVLTAVSVAIMTPAAVGAAAMPEQECYNQGGTPTGPVITGSGSYTIRECTLPAAGGSGGGSGGNSDVCQGALIRVNCGTKGEGIFNILNIVLDVLTVGVGIAATAGVVFAALRYTQARDNAESAAGAKKMIINIIIGLAIWALFWALLQWLLPGGRFN
jgi:hypothetical protein